MALFQNSILKKYLYAQPRLKRLLGELTKAKLKLSLGEEAEWMAYFNEQKSKAQALQTDISRLDREIDALVYELYGLTEEEIRIVEGGK
jgi:hypothetical protein